ncbi:hypothetical protein QVD17_02145 [Tagetes erecta]|uniref:BHLH domain-containing protein n=1 Tax=Tagetes erecta TaxID=13708 RepID=A0AAD8P8W9_TARER|nr:hypothetical protein QVD17_02145 [Tagetes erecta]
MVVSFEGDHRDQESDDGSKYNINGGDSSSSVSGGSVEVTKQENMTESASEKHALSERNRRKRINSHYDSLREFFPQLVKTDKASVLTETVRHLKELQNMDADIAPSQENGDSRPRKRVRRSFLMPGESDQVSVNYCDDNTTIRAIICCEDRPDLNQALREAIHLVGGKPVKAEMATVGGRTKVDVVVECGERGEEGAGLLLKRVVENKIRGRTELMSNVSTEPQVICDQTESGRAC